MTKKTLCLLTILTGLASALPAAAQTTRPLRRPYAERNVVRFQVGLFSPRGDSAYWNDKELEFTGSADDLEDFSFGIDYLRQLNARLGLLVSSNFYEGDAGQSYLDFEDEFGNSITHTATLEIASLNLGLVAHLLPRDSTVAPYLGAGGGYYAWRLEEAGEFIDFTDPRLPIFRATFRDEDETFGYYVHGGLDVPLSPTWTVFGEARWQRADDTLSGDFQGLGELDLSGWDFRAGMSWRF